MQIFRSLESLPEHAQNAAIAIGNFDGLHLGHQAVIETMKKIAKENHAPPAVLTFYPHPRMFFNPTQLPLKIEPFHLKFRRLKEAGVKLLYVLPFNAALSHMPAEGFIKEILHQKLKAKHIITGDDFIFGHKRGGDSALLSGRAADYGYTYHTVPPVMIDGAPCSSTRIRQALQTGDLSIVSQMLGRSYEITGRVITGDKRGRELGFPTANLYLKNIFLPAYGVYAVHFGVTDVFSDTIHTWHQGVANLGVRPTFEDQTRPQLEIHGLEFSGDLYGQCLRICFDHFLRPEKAFDSPEALKLQIAKDVAEAKQFWATA